MGIKNKPVNSVNSTEGTVITATQTVPTLLDGSSKDLQKQVRWSRIRRVLQDPFSEFFGTMILILFGDGVVAQVTLSQGQKGNYQSISWGWG